MVLESGFFGVLSTRNLKGQVVFQDWTMKTEEAEKFDIHSARGAVLYMVRRYALLGLISPVPRLEHGRDAVMPKKNRPWFSPRVPVHSHGEPDGGGVGHCHGAVRRRSPPRLGERRCGERHAEGL